MTLIEKARHLRAMIEKASTSLADEDALDAIELFPVWAVNIAYDMGTRVRYAQNLYKCVQAHTSQDDWTPANNPALWSEVAKPGEIPVWKQPTGAQDAYMKGDKVYYPDKNSFVYESEIDDNVWKPDVYGWKKVEYKGG